MKRILMYTRHILAEVALGETPADLAVVKGSVVNVYTAEILTGYSVFLLLTR